MSNNELSVSIPGFRNVSFEDEIFTVYKIHVINENKEYEIEKRFSAFKELHEAVGLFIFKKIDVINIFTLVRRWIWSLYGSFISQN